MKARWAVLAATLAVAACTSPGSNDPFVGFGPNPPLPKPQTSLIPSLGVPEVVGWPEGAAPKAPPGFTVTRYAQGLAHPRWLLTMPNGDVLAAESAAPPKPPGQEEKGIRGFFQKMLGLKQFVILAFRVRFFLPGNVFRNT